MPRPHRRYLRFRHTDRRAETERNLIMAALTIGDASGLDAPASIRYALGTCSLGAILLALTDAGVCAPPPANVPAPLVQNLAAPSPRSRLIDGDGGVEPWLAKAIACVETPAL